MDFNILNSLNISIKIIIFSMFPITELRLSIPYFIIVEDIDWITVVSLSILGNILIGLMVLYLIAPLMMVLSLNKYFKNIINFILNRTRSRSKIINQFKFLGIIMFVGIPLPFTGVWTGALSSYLLSIPRKKSALGLVIGVLISASIVTLLTMIFEMIPGQITNNI